MRNGLQTKHECKIEIIIGILAETLEGKSDKYLMDKLGLSYETLLHCLNFLLRNGLIVSETLSERKIYKTTEKGKKFLGGCERIKEII